MKKLFGISLAIALLALMIFLGLKLIDPDLPAPVQTAECYVEGCLF